MKFLRQFLQKGNLWLLDIAQVQPSESFLDKTVVDYFMDHPLEAFTVRQQLRIGHAPKNFPFKLATLDGNHRLYALNKSGMTRIPIVPLHVDEQELDGARLVYNEGITRWDQLRLLNHDEYMNALDEQPYK